jgi:Tol biopolymer transport system component
LWIRDIDSEQARPVPGATGVYQAFWSPGNQWIGYSSGQACGIRPGCDLVKIPVGGGTPRRIVRLAGSFKRAWWSSDGATIVYCDSLGLYTVPAEGGVAQRIVEHSHIEHPSVIDLSGGRRAFLYQALDAEQPGHAIYLQVAGESRRHLLKVSRSNNPYPAWSPTGHLIYVDGPNTRPEIWAMPLSLSDLKPAGNAFRIVERGASPMVSATGTLVYGDPPSNRSQMRWVDRSGRSLSTIGEGEAMSQVVLSRDGRSVAVAAADPEPDIFIYDAERGTRTRLTADPNAEAIGSWTPAGDEITYASFNTRESAILSRAPGAPVKEVLRGAPRVRRPEWSPDGRFLMYTTLDERNKGDLLYRERRAGGTLGDERVFLRTPAHEGEARFSPDGRRVAYVSDESGRPEVYITEFPEGRSRIRVSENGGGSPRWRRDGRELFYAEWGKLWAVSVAASAPIRAGRPAMLFEKRSVGLLQFDTAADGRRFVVLERPAGEPPLAVHVVQNWFEEFRTVR